MNSKLYSLFDRKREIFDLSDFREKIKTEGKKALREIRAGKKDSHWIWYFFPQLECLGISPNSKYYGIKSLSEAEAFLKDDYLRMFFVIMVKAVKKHLDKGVKVNKIFGYPDDQKFLSSMTLFYYASISLEDKGVFLDCSEILQFCMEYTEKELGKEDTKTSELCEKWLDEQQELLDKLQNEFADKLQNEPKKELMYHSNNNNNNDDDDDDIR